MTTSWPADIDLIDLAPVSLWLEDYSALKQRFDQWRDQGITDLAEYFREHPGLVSECWDLVKVLHINPRTLTLFGAATESELFNQLDLVLHTSDPVTATYPLVKLWDLPAGERSIQTDTVNTRLDGRRMDARINATILPGYEQSWALVLSSIEDVTELHTSEETLRQVTDQFPGVVYRVHIANDGTPTYLFVSAGVTQMFGVSVDAVLTDSNALLDRTLHEDRQALRVQLVENAHANAPTNLEIRVRSATGAILWVQMHSMIQHRDATGAIRNGVLIDVTARKNAEMQLRETEGRWKRALAATGDGMWEWTPTGGSRIYASHEQQTFGYSREEFETYSTQFSNLIHPDDVAQREADRLAYAKRDAGIFSNELRLRCKDGSYRWLLSRGVAVERDDHGVPTHMIGTYTDISDRKRSEQMIWRQANFDPLTGLPNRRMLRDRMEHEILKGKRDGSQLALLFLDLDHFKEVNDTLGHDRGDQLLVEAAQRIRDCVRETDTVARMGGDEFIILVAELTDTAHLQRILNNILNSLAGAFMLSGEQVFVSASIGITMYPQDGTEADALLKNADQALYAAKGDGRNRFSFFTPSLQAATLHRVRLTNDLRSALDNHEFSLVYQPIVHLGTGTVTKAEALLRWQHPSRGQVSPAEFIPIAETTGLIVDIGDWVVRQAARQAKRIREQLVPDFQISLNRSPAQFLNMTPQAPSWTALLEELGLPGEAIAIEITEGLLLDASPMVNQQLPAMRAAGIRVSLDDFGTGYSSLSYLQRYDIDFIKIDQSFVRNLQPESTNLALCKAIIVMAHVLGMQVIAEGVESAMQLELLTVAGCDYAQGYHIAHPMPPAEFEAFLSGHLRGSEVQ